MGEKLSNIKQTRLKRRLAISLAGARAGSRIIGQRSTDWLRGKENRESRRSELLTQEARVFVAKLGQLKGSYVKIGQMLALFGEHLLPTELTEALHTLEDQTTPLKWSIMQQQVETELGQRATELDIDPEPLAAASIGQVHRAVVRASGQAICLKIQYPGIRETIDSDFSDVLQMLRLANWLQAGREINQWLEEIRDLLHEEVDYRREAEMTRQMARRLHDDERYRVPQVLERYSTDAVLALSFEEGLDPGDSKVGRLSLRRRNALSRAMLDLFLREIYEWGVMQTDPNFGNYRLQLDSDGDKLVLLDFGAVRELPADFLQALRSTIASAMLDQEEGVIEGIIALNCLSEKHPDSAKKSFADFCMALLEPLRQDTSEIPEFALNAKGQYRWRDSRLIKRAGKLAAVGAFTQYFTMPPKEFALIARKLTGVFTFLSVLGAEFNGYSVLSRRVKQWQQAHEE